MHLSATRALARATCSLAALIVAASSTALSAQAPSSHAPIVLRNRRLALTFDGGDGHVTALRDRAHAADFVTTDTVALWTLHATGPGYGRQISPANAHRFHATRRAGHNDTIELVWDDFRLTDAPGLRVTAVVHLRYSAASGTPSSDTPLSEWRIRVDGLGTLPVDTVRFPRVGGIPRLGPAEELAVPQWMGQRTRDPRRRLAGKRLEWFYPGQLSLQAIALYQPDGPGLYLAADDTLAYRKSFALWGEPDGSVAYEMIHLLENPGHHASYATPYAALIGTFRGDWLTAAEEYRAWGTRQRWARESRLARGRVPDWMTQTGLWVWNRGRSPGVLPPAMALQRAAGVPVSVFWHWWHNAAYDTGFPDYLPPREGTIPFEHALGDAQAAGVHAIVYMNQRLWCVNTPSWTREDGERFAVRNPDGTIRTEVYNIFDPQRCATMDVATAGWRNKYAGIADTVLNQYGVDGIYMDQAVLSLVCYAPDHGHPIGGGHYWMDGFRELAGDIRRRDHASRPMALGGEGGGETWLPELDAFLTLQVSVERYADPASGWEVIPFFQAVYHPYGISYGSYSSLTRPPYDDLWPAKYAPPDSMALLDTVYRRQFYLEQARAFVWGMQPTIANFRESQLTERPRETGYAIRLARVRERALPFLLHGTFLRPPTTDAPTLDVLGSRVSIYAAQRGGVAESHIRAPAALTGAWRAPDGRVAIAIASIADDSLPLTLRIDPVAYHLPAGETVWRVDEQGRRTSVGVIDRGASVLHLELPPLGVAMLEIGKAR